MENNYMISNYACAEDTVEHLIHGLKVRLHWTKNKRERIFLFDLCRCPMSTLNLPEFNIKWNGAFILKNKGGH